MATRSAAAAENKQLISFSIITFWTRSKIFESGLWVLFNWDVVVEYKWLVLVWLVLVWLVSKFINHSIYHCVITIITWSISQDQTAGRPRRLASTTPLRLTGWLACCLQIVYLVAGIDLTGHRAENVLSHLLTTWELSRSTDPARTRVSPHHRYSNNHLSRARFSLDSPDSSFLLIIYWSFLNKSMLADRIITKNKKRSAL